jgi:hypothetical protein
MRIRELVLQLLVLAYVRAQLNDLSLHTLFLDSSRQARIVELAHNERWGRAGSPTPLSTLSAL